MRMLFQSVCGEKRFVKNVYERWEEDSEGSNNDSTVKANANELVTEEASAYLGGH